MDDSGEGALSGLTLRNHFAVLRKALQDAVSLRLLSVNPALAVAPPRWERKDTVVLDEKQTMQFLAHAKGWEYHFPVYLAAYTGVRRGELLGSRWGDVDWEGETIRVSRSLQKTSAGFIFGPPKSKKSRRVIAHPDSVMASLEEEQRLQGERKKELGSDYHDQGLICCKGNGDPIESNGFSAAFRDFQDKSTKELGLPRIRLHDPRHGHCSHLLRLNQPLELVSARLGHSTIAITADLCGHILEGQEREAMELLDAAMTKAQETTQA